MDEAVIHYINSHPTDEAVHVDANNLALNVQDDGGSRIAIMHSQTYSTSLCRQVSVGDQVTEGQWGEELLDPNRLAVIMAHISAQTRAPLPPHQKVVQTVRSDVDASVILDNSIRLFNGQALDDPSLVTETEGPVLELAGESPVHNRQQNKKSLPHKKRISRRLRRNNGGSTPQQDLVVISCSEEGHHEEILPDTFVTSVQHQDHLPDETHHITHEVRPVLICQLCGEFYGEEQLKFFHHLKQHYEPHIIIENPVPDLGIDKMTTCIVDNVATLPDAIVELSLENSVPKTMYQPIDKHVLYSTHDKPLVYSNHRIQYSVASMDKEQTVTEVDKAALYDTLDKLELYSCGKCNKSFRKHKQYEAHVKETHHNTKVNLQLEDMGEFSEPEDLMEGIHVAVDEPAEQYEQTLLPHLTVENGHAHQDGPRHWYGRGNWAYCGCGNTRDRHEPQHLKVLKEEVLQRILETEVANDSSNYSDNMIQEANEIPETEAHPPEVSETQVIENETAETEAAETETHEVKLEADEKSNKKGKKCFQCRTCNRVFQHRNSLFYHTLSHIGKTQVCRDCGKGFYTSAALKIHRRVHNGDRPYKCDECGREFRQWNDLKNHKVSIHSNQKMFKCEFCNKEFARKYSLNVHRRIHTGERNYKCELCNKSFRASSYRLTHMRTHTGDKPHKCPECDKCFGVAADLRRHLLVHDKMRNRNNLIKIKVKDEPQKKPQKIEEYTIISENITESIQKMKKIAVASTTKMPTQKQDKKPTKNQNSKKNSTIKKPPNVTIDQIDKSYTESPNFDIKNGQYSKEFNVHFKDLDQFTKPNIGYRDEQNGDKEFVILRPLYRGNVCESEVDKSAFRTENTDGKMTVFTHIEKNKEFINTTIVPASQMSLSDIRNLERDVRSEITGDAESGFIERLTALYNIPAV